MKPIKTSVDLLGQEVNEVEDVRAQRQAELFEVEHKLTAEEKRKAKELAEWKRRRELEKQDGQGDLIE